VFPKPRNIQAGRFRLIRTSNNVPSRDDLHAVLLRGMPGSSMPPWGHLSQVERNALVDEVLRLRLLGARALYVKILKEEEEMTDEEIAAEDVQQEIQEYVDGFKTPGESTVVPEFGEPTDEAMVRAREIYAKYGCLPCHGAEGKGDGVEKMVDDEGYPTAPRDFTAGVFKGGADPASLYRRIAYGMPGTPMPSSTQMTPEQMVELVHYIRAMSTDEQRQAAVLNREKITAKSLDALPADASAGAWSEPPVVSLRMVPLWWRNNADPDLQVQAAHDDQLLAVRISWKDDRRDGHAASSESFEDAVALQLYRGDAEPFLGMGGPKSAVDVWFWDIDRQGTPLAVEALYPHAVVDVYPFSETVVASAELDRDGARTADQPDISLPARAVGNQIVPPGGESGATSLTGGGPGTSTFRPPTSQHVLAVGQWENGRWTVVMTRRLRLASPDDGVSLAPGDKVSVAFAVWDGAAKDRDGKKLITIWQDLVLEK
jgi:DMSO reductase family type II enzyme heme b subunit